jgi:hypothetical protein
MQEFCRVLEEQYGVVVEAIEGGEPIDIMKHLGERNEMHSVIWRCGCWGERGVLAILAGAVGVGPFGRRFLFYNPAADPSFRKWFWELASAASTNREEGISLCD